MLFRVIQSLLVDETLSQRQRWSHLLTVLLGVLALAIAVNLRDNALFAADIYINTEAGITAQYPRGWLRDSTDQAIFRVRDVTHPGYQTTIQIAIDAVSAQTTERSIRDALTLNRAQNLTRYDIIDVQTLTLPDETTATQVSFAYVYADPNPFLQSVPVAVEGIDLITIRRGQVIVITFTSDTRVFDQNYEVFERFINDLEF